MEATHERMGGGEPVHDTDQLDLSRHLSCGGFNTHTQSFFGVLAHLDCTPICWLTPVTGACGTGCSLARNLPRCYAPLQPPKARWNITLG